MPQQELRIVIGLGKSGLSLVRFLVAKGFAVAVADTRQQPPGAQKLAEQFPEVATCFGELNPDFLAQAKIIYVSPGLATSHPALQHAAQQGALLAGDIDLFAEYAQAPIVAITGSNAKSSVTTLLGEMAVAAGAKVAVGGNLGTPVLELLDDSVELYVLELSSFQLETTHQLAPLVATCLNISEDHMDRYPAGIQSYIAAKQRIFNQAQFAVVNRDDSRAFAPQEAVTESYSFGLSEPKTNTQFGLRTVGDQRYLALGQDSLLALSALKLTGLHNVSNILAALALGKTCGLALGSMLQAAQNFSGLAHRCRWVTTLNQVEWFNDSKGTNVGATLAALAGLRDSVQGKIILIAGGDGKGADFSELRAPVAGLCREVILLGKDAATIADTLSGATQLHSVSDLEQAVKLAHQLAQPQDLVLLSPACSSLDMFNSFEQRGELFEQAVRSLAG